ncbi:hypothetical protein BHE74_00006709 [Ensete ventricosum]|nr:hypothetical protein GW17_00027818 [Ensete ventricosum]RWW84670.1 hypothetical protein BHE74_00006709 [Ensete ventricosum]RZS02261.1 hypothetical protein BHM03_00032270 [Ensete ventricosum]
MILTRVLLQRRLGWIASRRGVVTACDEYGSNCCGLEWQFRAVGKRRGGRKSGSRLSVFRGVTLNVVAVCSEAGCQKRSGFYAMASVGYEAAGAEEPEAEEELVLVEEGEYLLQRLL